MKNYKKIAKHDCFVVRLRNTTCNVLCSKKNRGWRGAGGGGGGGGEGEGGNLEVIRIRVCEPIFRKLPHSYTWPLKKRTHSYNLASKMLSYSYTAL